MEYCTLGAYMHIHTFKVVKCGLVLFSLVPSGLPGLTGALLCKQTANSFFSFFATVLLWLLSWQQQQQQQQQQLTSSKIRSTYLSLRNI